MAVSALRILRYLVFSAVLWGLIVLAVLQLWSSETQRPNFLFERGTSLDKTSSRSEAMIIEEIQQKIPNLPFAYWNRHKNGPMRVKNESCAEFPSVFDLEFRNSYWQSLYTSNGTFQLFGAYYDVERNTNLGSYVRILAMINRIKPTVNTYCQFWFETQEELVVVKVLEYKFIWRRKWGNYRQGIYQPYLIACQVPKPYHNVVPASVSIVEEPCNTATNNLRVIYNKPDKKKKFAVCVKGLDFLHEDLSVRLVEWIELLGILGVDKVFFYELQIHPSVSKVLQYYQKLDRVDVTPLTLPGGQPNVPGFQHMYLVEKLTTKRQNELIPYNDCLYRNLYSYEYIVLLDIDEVIMPMNTMSWQELINIVLPKARDGNDKDPATYCVQNVYFFDDIAAVNAGFEDIPRHMHMLQHVYRSNNFTKTNHYVKCFHKPERVLTLHNHFPLDCLGGACSPYSIDTSDAQLQHYRADCVKSLQKNCVEFRLNIKPDKTIWKFKHTLITRTDNTLKKLGLFG
jgi:hypothetical protein